MPKHKSPGQKRKGIVRTVSVLFFLVATYAASTLLARFNDAAYEWTGDHQVIAATVTQLTYEEEEYRNLKGRKRTKDVYYVDYEFEADGSVYDNSVEVDASLYSTLEEGGEVLVWYATEDPWTNDIGQNVEEALASDNTIGNMLGVAPYTGPASYFLYWLLSLLFVRESKKAMPEGFFTDSSWLDIDDKYIVALNGNTLVYFKFDEKHATRVQDAYQEGASVSELVKLSRASEVTEIPLVAVEKVSSDHNSDVITVTQAGEDHSVEFLNPAVKAHALERIKPLLPGSLDYDRKERTRLQAAMPAMGLLGVLAAAIAYTDLVLLNLLFGFIIIFFVAPRMISRLLDPTITETWTAASEGQPEVAT